VLPFPITVPPGTDPGKFLPSKTLDQASTILLPEEQVKRNEAKTNAGGKYGSAAPHHVLPFPMTVAPGTDPGIFMPSDSGVFRNIQRGAAMKI
jgi:hypothetical protein